MPLSKIFSALTSNAFYKAKIVIENNSAIQPQKITVVVTPSVGDRQGSYFCHAISDVFMVAEADSVVIFAPFSVFFVAFRRFSFRRSFSAMTTTNVFLALGQTDG